MPQPDYASIAKHCNLWRNYDDIQDSWSSVTAIIDYYGDNQDVLIPLAGPGHWNDPDMLIIGGCRRGRSTWLRWDFLLRMWLGVRVIGEIEGLGLHDKIMAARTPARAEKRYRFAVG